MKTTLLLILLLSLCFAVMAQNVSINTIGASPSDPKALLEVRKPQFSKLKIRTDSYTADTSVLELSNRTSGNTGTAMLFSLLNEEGLVVSSVSDIGSNTKDSLLTLKINGNMGFGIRNPAYNYHFHTPTSTTNVMSITNNTTGVGVTDGLLIGMNGGIGVINNMETNSLRLGTGNLTRLAIDAAGNVGIGTLSPGYKLDVNGDVNLTGAMRLNGSAGTAGQVLTSNGVSDAEWKTTSFSNNTRFAFDVSLFSPGTSLSSTGGFLNFSGTKYNLDPASVSASGTSLTISKTGLYHFEFFYKVQFFYTSAAITISPAHRSYISIDYAGGFNHDISFDDVLRKQGSTNSWYYNAKASMDIYIQAPRVILLYSGFAGLAGSTNSVTQDGFFYGHLISE